MVVFILCFFYHSNAIKLYYFVHKIKFILNKGIEFELNSYLYTYIGTPFYYYYHAFLRDFKTF